MRILLHFIQTLEKVVLQLVEKRIFPSFESIKDSLPVQLQTHKGRTKTLLSKLYTRICFQNQTLLHFC